MYLGLMFLICSDLNVKLMSSGSPAFLIRIWHDIIYAQVTQVAQLFSLSTTTYTSEGHIQEVLIYHLCTYSLSPDLMLL